MLRTHGITREQASFINEPTLAAGQESGIYPAWYMEMQELGYNYRLTDIQAALGLSQLARAEEGLQKRREIALRYDIAFEDCSPVKSQLNELKNHASGHAYHLYVAQVEDRLGLYNFLRENKIYCQIHYIPTHLMPYYQKQGWKPGDFPIAETYYKRCISLPMYPALTLDEQQFVIDKIKSYYDG